MQVREATLERNSHRRVRELRPRKVNKNYKLGIILFHRFTQLPIQDITLVEWK